ncbi:MAG: hypothetical protein CL512_05970 [Actinobacteria bacterium]|nr:hypothetical protein [Actinomycetota bacterium]
MPNPEKENDKPFTYEDKSEEIDIEIRKRRGKWFLDSLAWFDFEDVEQIIRAHIHKKWHLWNQEMALGPWLNKVITNQMKNILRNNYSNFVRPCLNCPFNQCGKNQAEGAEDSLCGFTSSGRQDSECPLYAKWERTKKAAYDIKMALALENHSAEANAISDSNFDIDSAEKRLHESMKKKLPERQYKIYHMLFVKNMDDEDVAKVMGYKTSEKGRTAGYKQIKNLKKLFKQKASEILAKEDIIIHDTKNITYRGTKRFY